MYIKRICFDNVWNFNIIDNPNSTFLIENTSKNDFELDKTVILTKVVNLKTLGLAIMLLTVPIFVYSLNMPYIKVTAVLGYMLGIHLFLLQILKAIKWIDIKQTNSFDKNMSYRNQKRYEFLQGNKTYEEELNVWGYIFEQDLEKTDMDEIEVISIFFDSAKKFYNQSVQKRGLLVLFRVFYLEDRKFSSYAKRDWLDSDNDYVFKTILIKTIEEMDIEKAKVRSNMITIYPKDYDPKNQYYKTDSKRDWRNIRHIKQQDNAWMDFDEKYRPDPYYPIFIYLTWESTKNEDLQIIFNSVIQENKHKDDLVSIVSGILTEEKRWDWHATEEGGKITEIP